MEMEYMRAFTYVPEDPQWPTKWGLAGAVTLVPGLGALVAAGYGLEIARRVIHDRPPVLPDWGDFADYARKGLGAAAIAVIYWLPLFLVILCVSVPTLLLSLAGRNNTTADTLMGWVSVCLGLFGVVYGVLTGMLLQAALGRYAATDQLGAALRLGEVWGQVRAHPGPYLMTMLVSGLGTLILTAVGVIACAVGAAWGAAYGQLVHGHLLGQAQRHAQAQQTSSGA